MIILESLLAQTNWLIGNWLINLKICIVTVGIETKFHENFNFKLEVHALR